MGCTKTTSKVQTIALAREAIADIGFTVPDGASTSLIDMGFTQEQINQACTVLLTHEGSLRVRVTGEDATGANGHVNSGVFQLEHMADISNLRVAGNGAAVDVWVTLWKAK